jgi:hypothetical protein
VRAVDDEAELHHADDGAPGERRRIQLDGGHEPHRAHIANGAMARLQVQQPVAEVFALGGDALHESRL